MENALVRFNINPVIHRWISMMLRQRTVESTLRVAIATKRITRGCPQGGVLSQLLWNLVVDELLERLKQYFPSVISQGLPTTLVYYKFETKIPIVPLQGG